MQLVALVLAGFVVAGMLVSLAGLLVVRHFVARPRHPAGDRPAVSILRPLCGDEPLLDAALASLCAQAYPEFQIVLGVQDEADPALAAARRLQARHPGCDIAVVVDPALHGPNRKVSNLINMLPAARHDILVFSDSDLHVAPSYLEQLVACLAEPGTGLVTTLCIGRPADAGLAARLAAAHINHSFLPGVLLARALRRQDCLGTTMALHRATLLSAGGLAGLVGHLADDNVLGQRVQALGLRVRLADTLPAATIAEVTLAAVWRHELRWSRTIAALQPTAFAASILQFPLFWSVLACVASFGAVWSLCLLAGAWALRAGSSHCIDRMLRARYAVRPAAVMPWFLPLRDLLSVLQVGAGFCGNRVVWRGHSWTPERQARTMRLPVAIRTDSA